MQQYIVRRLLLFVPTVLATAVIIFFILRVMPGDVATLILLGHEGGVATQREIDMVRESLGLDRPLHVQFVSWVGGVIHGDFGESLWTSEPVLAELGRRLPVSLQIAVMASILSAVVGIPLGVVSALRQDTTLDYIIRVISIGGLAMPAFWLAIMVLLVLVAFANWSPPLEYVSPFKNPSANLQMLIWPALAVGFRHTAVGLRMTRATMLEVMREDYVRTARSKGLREATVVWRHAVRNAMIPVVTIVAMEFAVMLGGLVTTETVFNVPGIGKFVAESILQRDFPMVQGIILVLVFVVLATNLLTDMTYSWLDPRVRYQ